MRHLYLNSNSRENLISFGVNSNTFRENNLKLRLPLNFRLWPGGDLGGMVADTQTGAWAFSCKQIQKGISILFI